MRRFVIIILVFLCWSIVPIHATMYHTNGGATYGVLNNGYGNPYSHSYYSEYKTSSQSPTMTMRSTSLYSVNPYSMNILENDRMQESGILSYGLMNMNSNIVYCPGVAPLGVMADHTSENIPSMKGGPRKVSPDFHDKDHWWVYDGTTNTWKCAKCSATITSEEYDDEDYDWCPVPLEFDWKVIVFMAGLLAVYAYIKKTDITPNSDVRNGRDMLA